MKSDSVLPLADVAAADPAVAGAKAATLSQLSRAGFPVPQGFVIPVTASRAVAEGGSDDVARAADELGGPLAVRSSGVDEDSATASYAGQFASVLGVSPGPALFEAIGKVAASAAGAGATGYRERLASGAGHDVAVLIQSQVPADSAGVAFTADPVTGDRDRVLVSAVRGLGERLVSGAATPHEWVVRGDAAEVIAEGDDGRVLGAVQARQVAELARRVEEWAGEPVDIEWAIADGVVHLLQARPITALPTPPPVDLPEGAWIKESGRRAQLLTPFGASIVLSLVGDGLSAAFAESGSLLERIEQRCVGGEVYLRIVPLGGRRALQGAPPPWWLLGLIARVAPPLRARCKAAKRACRPGAGDDYLASWSGDWQPRILDRLARLRSRDLGAMSDAELNAHIGDTIDLLRDGLAVHFKVIAPYSRALYSLFTTCRDLLGYDANSVLALLAGTSSATSEPVRALADVVTGIGDGRGVRAALDRAPDDPRAALAATDEAAAAAFDEWHERYAWRILGEDPGAPTLAEQPAMLAMVLSDALDGGGLGRDIEEARLRAIGRARSTLATRRADLARFDAALAAAAKIYPSREATAVWAACHPAGLVRRAVIEVGRRLEAAGFLARAEDVVLLSVDTVRAALRGGVDGLRARAAKARAEIAWTAAHPGPPVYGPPPSASPDFRGLPSAARFMNEALMWTQNLQHNMPKPVGPDGALRGAPGSPGSYTGPARIVCGFADFDRVRPGDVVVCPATDPSWSVLFGAIGALVTEGGGALSHAAIVAREHGIPAVLAVAGATTAVRDGELVSVDGGAGIVVRDVQQTVAAKGE